MIFAAFAASCVLRSAGARTRRMRKQGAAQADRGGENTSRQECAEAGGDDGRSEPEVFQLKDPVYVQFTGLKEFLDENECRKAKNLAPRKLVLFLDGIVDERAGRHPRRAASGEHSALLSRPHGGEQGGVGANSGQSLDRATREEAQCRHRGSIPVQVRYQDQVPLAAGVLFRSRPNLLHRLDDRCFSTSSDRTNICREGSPKAPAGVSAGSKHSDQRVWPVQPFQAAGRVLVLHHPCEPTW